MELPYSCISGGKNLQVDKNRPEMPNVSDCADAQVRLCFSYRHKVEFLMTRLKYKWAYIYVRNY